MCFCLHSMFLPVTRSFHPFLIKRRLIFELICGSTKIYAFQKSRINLLDCLLMFYFCLNTNSPTSDWPFLAPYRSTIPNQKMAYIFPILCILGIIFPKSLRNFPKCKGKGSFPKSQIKSLPTVASPYHVFLEKHVFSE